MLEHEKKKKRGRGAYQPGGGPALRRTTVVWSPFDIATKRTMHVWRYRQPTSSASAQLYVRERPSCFAPLPFFRIAQCPFAVKKSSIICIINFSLFIIQALHLRGFDIRIRYIQALPPALSMCRLTMHFARWLLVHTYMLLLAACTPLRVRLR